MTFDAFIFSCDWNNYQDNVLVDKESMTVGAWSLDSEKIKSVKYAYAYLTNSDKTVVKKFHINNWEHAREEKGYPEDWKVCFTFSKSEDVFFEWHSHPVQSPQYVSSSELDNLPRLNEEQIKVNLHKSEVTPKTPYHSPEFKTRTRERKPRSSSTRSKTKMETNREKLVKVYNDKFKHIKFKDLSALSSLDQQVAEGQEPEVVLTNYFNSLKKE